MSRAVVAALVLGACAHGTGPGGAAPVHAPATISGAGAPVDAPPATLLGRQPDDAEVLLFLSVARAHPLGPRLEPFVLAWPGWGATIRRISEHPLAELDWIDVVGPKDPAKERLATRTAVPDDGLDARLASTGDGTLRLVVRGQPHLVAAGPPSTAEALRRALAASRVVDPVGETDEGLRADLPHPHAFFRVVPDEVRRGLLRVFARPGGAAEARLDLECGDAEVAARVALTMRSEAERVNGAVVKLLTLDLLGGLRAEVDGATVHLSLPATREQLEALATLASGMLPPPASR